jgi:Phage integrase, N-terminal SAM-like domain
VERCFHSSHRHQGAKPPKPEHLQDETECSIPNLNFELFPQQNDSQVIEQENYPVKTNTFANIDPNTPYQAQVAQPDKPQPIRHWQQKWEQHLPLMGKSKETQRRYARALEKFLGKNKGKAYAHDFFRPHINDYIQTRLAEGAAISTVRLEISAIRAFWNFMEEMGVLLLNPTKGVRVPNKNRSQEPSSVA